ncbi:MAG: virulence RhuM family protein [Kiritimatiellae bacterium]|nr:virulence RhuM family protein [Kiritimatiellia bacterium]
MRPPPHARRRHPGLIPAPARLISRHIRNIFAEGELDQQSNLHFLQIAHSDRPVTLYSLDVIISVGYRVKSAVGTRFRQWANKVIKDYLLRGYSVNARLNQLKDLGRKCFAFTKLDAAEIAGLKARI